MAYYSGQGKCYVAERTAGGVAKAFRFLGNVPELSVQMETEKNEHKESTSGGRIVDQITQTGKKASVSFALEEFTIDNLCLLLYGVKVSKTGATVTDEVLPTGIVNEDFVRLDHPNIIDTPAPFVLKDSTGTPATVPGANYTLNKSHGSLQIHNIATFVQPFKATYTYGAYDAAPLLTSGLTERWLRFEGLNTVDSNKPVLVELYRVTFDPAKELPFLQDDLAKFTMDGNALYDALKAGNADLGQFGRVIKL